MEDVKLKPWELREPRNLAGLIDIYESNYFRLMRLVPDLETLDGTVVSRVAGALDLYLTIRERQRYTTTIVLTYRFPEDDETYLEPNARISVCHDVRTAEVVGHCRRRRQMGEQRTAAVHGAADAVVAAAGITRTQNILDDQRAPTLGLVNAPRAAAGAAAGRGE